MTEPTCSEEFRTDLVNYFQWCDKNGCYSDANCEEEGMPRMTFLDCVANEAGAAISNAEYFLRIGTLSSKVDSLAGALGEIDITELTSIHCFAEHDRNTPEWQSDHRRFLDMVYAAIDIWFRSLPRP